MSVVNEEYIDVDDALKRIGGNRDLYKRLLQRFLEGKQLEELDAALEKGDADEASRAAHTIKGVAANLSLVKLRTISTDLEMIIKEDLEYGEKLDELKEAYDETVKMIAVILS